VTAATFGDLLSPARGHLACAAGFPDNFLRAESAIAAAGVTSRLALTLSRYLADIVPYGMAEAITNPSLRPRVRAAVDGREALRMAAATLCTAAAGTDSPGRDSADPLVASLAAAGDSLSAGRDLLRTHFATSPDGSSLQESDWSAVITSAPVTRALAAEAASWSRQLAFLMARLSQAAETHEAVPAAVRHGLASGCQWLLTASAALTAGQRSAPATLADASLLHAIPANTALPRQPPGDGETAGALAGAVAASAARLRVVTWRTAEQAAWSEAMTAESWRWTATGAAVTCHISQLLLQSLAGRPGLFTGMPEVALQLRAADESAARACARWRDAASAWNDITTETRGLTAPGIPDLGDLITGLGRLAFTDSGWTPARVRHSPARNPAELAPGPAQFTAVVSAVHHAVSAVASIAATDRRAVDVAVRASRLHVPTRTLPDGYDVPRKFANAVPSTTAALLDAYQAASAASDLAVADLDGLAATVGAPSRILGFARAAVRLGPDMTFAFTTDAGATRMADPGATRMPDRLPARAAATAPAPDGRELAASSPPGPAELAVRENGTPDLGLLMRASVIDKATRLLIAEVKGSADGPGAPGQTAGDGRPGEAGRSPARVAGEGFPAGPVASRAGRRPGRARSGGLPPVRRTAAPGRIPPGGRRQPL
jgi:hypothetical protein